MRENVYYEKFVLAARAMISEPSQNQDIGVGMLIVLYSREMIAQTDFPTIMKQ